MNNWILLLFIVDAAFMVGILYMLYSYKRGIGAATAGLAFAGGGGAASIEGLDTGVIEKLREELDAAKAITQKLDKKRNELEELERSLLKNKKVLDKVVKRATVEPRIQKRIWHDTYEGATDMLNHGADVSDVIEKFDLLSGEAELITSLNALRN